MKRLMHNFAIGFICLCTLSSCNQDKQLFENKYVKGVVIALAKNGEIGFVEMSNDHDQSYLAMYSFNDLKNISLSLYDSVYFKVKAMKEIPIAYDLTKNLSSDKEVYLSLPKTTIRYHAFYDHSENQSFHKIGHLRPGFVGTINSEGFYPIKFYIKPSNDEVIFYADEARKEKALSLGEGIAFIDSNNEYIIQDIDTCHRHGDHVIQCRQDLN